MKLIEVNPFLRFAAVIRHIPPGNTVCVSDCRLFFVLSGSCDIFIGKVCYTLNKNSILYCAGGSVYTIVSEENVHIISLNFDLSQEHSRRTAPIPPHPITDMKYEIYKDKVSDADILNVHMFRENGSSLKPLFEKVVSDFSSSDKYFFESACASLKQIIIELVCFNYSNNNAQLTPVSRVIEFIKENYSRNISNSELAQLVGYHPYHLNRLFIKQTGLSIHKYILNLRLTEAQCLILDTDLSLSDISTKVGFNNYTYFSNYFKTHFGLSPARYRNSFKDKI